MDDELRALDEALVMKMRLRVLADVQVTYFHELVDRGMESSVAEQLLLDWSRQAFGMTFRSLPEPGIDLDLDALLGTAAPARGAQPAPPLDAPADDPSSVPAGEPWLQLVQDLHDTSPEWPEVDGDVDEPDDRAA